MTRPALVELTLTRWRVFHREPSAVFWTFGFPLALTLVLGLAFRSRPPEAVEVAVVSPPDHPLLERLRTRHPELHLALHDARGAHESVRTGRAALAVTLRRGTDPVAVDYEFDPTRPESRLARLAVDDAIQRESGREDRIRPSESRIEAVGSRYIDFLIPGLLGMNLMSSGLWGLGYALVDLRVKKLLKRLAATPMRRGDLLASFLLFRLAYLLVEAPVLLVFAWLLFGVTVHGSLALFALLATLGTLAFACIGLLLASRAENTQTVGGLMNLVSMPMMLCSGVFFSYERFPAALHPFLRVLPLTTLVDAMRAVMIDGAGLRAVWVPVVALAAWSLGSFALAVRWFRWR